MFFVADSSNKYKFGTVCERDIDVLLLNSFAVNPDFIELFTEKITEISGPDLSGASIVSVELSKSDPRWGESDVTVIVEKGGERYAILIEDKVGAKEQPDQCGRYDERGKIGINNGEYNAYFVFICAAKDYIEENAEAKKYKYSVSFEELSVYFSTKSDVFSGIMYEHIQQALVSSKIPYKKIVDEKATAFWNAYVEMARVKFPSLQLPNGSKEKSKSGDWPVYNTQLNYNLKVYIQHKMSEGIIDLTFGGMADRQAELEGFLRDRIADYETSGFGIAKVGKSAALRKNLGRANVLDFQKPFEEQREIAYENFKAIESLHNVAAQLNRTEVIELIEKNN